MLGTLFLIHRVELIQPVSQHARDQEVSAYNCSFVSIIQSYNCKQVAVGLLHAVKMAEVVLLTVFRIVFPEYLSRLKSCGKVKWGFLNRCPGPGSFLIVSQSVFQTKDYFFTLLTGLSIKAFI